LQEAGFLRKRLAAAGGRALQAGRKLSVEARMTKTPMAGPSDPLVLDLVEWIAREPRLYSEVIENWRTSCPRLTIWEDAVDHGYVARETGARVAITPEGQKLLREHGRVA
jgi:hypothetical protein